MKNILLVLLLANSLLLMACTKHEPAQLMACGTEIAWSSMTGVEKKAVEDALARNTKDCGGDHSKCSIKISQSQGYDVQFQKKTFDENKKECVPVIGGTWIERYDQAGNHERTIRSF